MGAERLYARREGAEHLRSLSSADRDLVDERVEPEHVEMTLRVSLERASIKGSPKSFARERVDQGLADERLGQNHAELDDQDSAEELPERERAECDTQEFAERRPQQERTERDDREHASTLPRTCRARW